MRILSFDPSFNNWGYSIAELHDNKLTIIGFGVLKNKTKKDKKVRQNIQDLNRCIELYNGLCDLTKDIDLLCAELPVGSQSSRAMVSYATCIALTASISVLVPKLIVCTPNEVKRLVGSNTASKDDVINWVKDKHPELNLPSKTYAEHICDSIVAMYVCLTKRELI